METLKVSKMYLNAWGHETVKCTVPGKFENLECDIIEGKVSFQYPQMAGFDDYCPELYSLQDVLTIKHNNNIFKQQAIKKVKLKKEIIDKNKWYTNGDKETMKIIKGFRGKFIVFVIDYLSKYPNNVLAPYYKELLVRIRTTDPIYKDLPINISNRLPRYIPAREELTGSQSSMMLLLRHVYAAQRKGSISFTK